MKIAAVIVTYNRKNLLKLNLDAINGQIFKVDKCYIIDNNGNDGTGDMVEEYNSQIPIEYIYLSENIGGAGGFNYGLNKAYMDGYDWIILMDDDGRPYDDRCFYVIVEYIKKNKIEKKSCILNSIVICNEKELTFSLGKDLKSFDDLKNKLTNNVIIDKINPFNGTFISKELVKTIGLPRKEFFIKGDEVDYCNRAIKSGAFVATVYPSLYYHPKAKVTKTIKLFNKKYQFLIEDAWKEFYSIRNFTYSSRELGDKKAPRIRFLKRVIVIIVCHKNFIKTLMMLFKGYRDGKKGKLGKTVTP